MRKVHSRLWLPPSHKRRLSWLPMDKHAQMISSYAFHRYIKVRALDRFSIRCGETGCYKADMLGNEWAREQLEYEQRWLRTVFEPWLQGMSFRGVPFLPVLRGPIWNFVLSRLWLRTRLRACKEVSKLVVCEMPRTSLRFWTLRSLIISAKVKTRNWLAGYSLLGGIVLGFGLYGIKARLDKLFGLPAYPSRSVRKDRRGQYKVVTGVSPAKIRRALDWKVPGRTGKPVVVLLPPLRCTKMRLVTFARQFDAAGIKTIIARPGYGINLYKIWCEFAPIAAALRRRLSPVLSAFENLGGSFVDLLRIGILFGGHVALGFPSAHELTKMLGGGHWHFTSAQSGMANALIEFVRQRGGTTSHQAHGIIADIMRYRTRVDLNYVWSEWDAQLMRKYGWDKQVIVQPPFKLHEFLHFEKRQLIEVTSDELTVLVVTNLLMCKSWHPEPLERLYLPFAWEFMRCVCEWVLHRVQEYRKVTIVWKPHPRESVSMYRKLWKKLKDCYPSLRKVEWYWIETFEDPRAKTARIVLSTVSSVAVELIARNKAVFLYVRPPYDKETFISCFSPQRKFNDSKELEQLFRNWRETGATTDLDRNAMITYLYGRKTGAQSETG